MLVTLLIAEIKIPRKSSFKEEFFFGSQLEGTQSIMAGKSRQKLEHLAIACLQLGTERNEYNACLVA